MAKKTKKAPKDLPLAFGKAEAKITKGAKKTKKAAKY
jgi:hypothetical protein